jgi:hypothetical protein
VREPRLLAIYLNDHLAGATIAWNSRCVPRVRTDTYCLLDVRYYFANLDALESDSVGDHLRHLIRRSPSSVL